MTFDTIISYIDSNYDPYDFPDYNSFIDRIVEDWQLSSNNPYVITRGDIQEGLFEIYGDTFELEPPESFEELIEEFSEPEEEPGFIEPPEIIEDIQEAKSLLSEIKGLFKKLFKR